MKRRKLKSYVLPMIMILAITSVITGTSILSNSLKNNKDNTYEEPTSYVTDSILEEDIAVINQTKKIVNPYTDTTVTIGKNYYDYKADSETQEKSIIYHDNTYLQNSGTDFISENVFDVIAVLNGSVTDVKEDDTLGKIVEIKHENGYVSIYQSLSEITVKKGDVITQGQVIGKSGMNELDKDMGNHLHFELYVNGQVVDPTLYLNKEIETSENKGE